MRIAVIGAGIVGVTSAYELARDGHAVTVLDTSPTVAGGASFNTGGLLSPAHASPWAAPGMQWRLLSNLLSRHAPLRMGWTAPWAHASWLWRWWRAARPVPYLAHRRQLFGLARYSQARLDQLGSQSPLAYERGTGLTILLRNDRELARARNGLKFMTELGVGFELLDAERTRQIEPGLSAETPLRGAIHLPGDALGNCRQLAHVLKAEAERLGAQFRFRQTVDAITPATRGSADTPGTPVTLHVAGQALPFDATVVCAGADAATLLRPLGLKLPLLPVWGYSLTVPLRALDGHDEHGPRAALVDETYQVSMTRLGQRVRVSGTAEIGGNGRRFHPGAVATLYRVLHDWFPGAGQLAQAQRWKGARAMLPDGLPLLGASGRPGVWLNVGHGDHGWTLACGSARVLADLVAERTPEVSIEGLGANRWA